MENIEDVSAFVRSLNVSIENLSLSLNDVFSQNLEDIIANCSSPSEKAEIYHSHLYTVISILFAYVKVLGLKTESHPIMRELTRIKASMKAFKEIREAAAKKTGASEKSADAANQFLRQTLGTTGGNAAPESLKSPAISSANFKGKHIKFNDLKDDNVSSHHKRANVSGKVSKSQKRKN